MLENPINLCGLLRRENSKSIHITDHDSFMNSNYYNRELILEMSGSVDIPFSLYSDFDSVEECKSYLDGGIYRVCIGKLAITAPEGVENLIQVYKKSRIAFAFWGNNGIIKNDVNDNIIDIKEFADNIKM